MKTASERLLDRILYLGLKPHLTRAEQREYDQLVATRDAYLRATGQEFLPEQGY